MRAGTSAALAYATGGASTVVSVAKRASTTARTARRVALTARLAAAAKNSTAPNRGPAQSPARPGPTGPMPIRTQPAPRPGREDTPVRRQVIVGEVVQDASSSQGKTAQPAKGKDKPARGKGSPTTRRPAPNAAPAAASPGKGSPTTRRPAPNAAPAAAATGDPAAAARLRARLAARTRGHRRSA